jgi:glycosyltransferase involved in cell wall biosynthesis
VDAVVAVSNGVADDINRRTGFPRKRINTVYNPSVTPHLVGKSKEKLNHPWFAPGQPPVILGAGRLGRAKDFPNLIQAFAKVRQQRPVRLMILGEAKHPRKTSKRRTQLTALAESLGVSEDLALPGFAQNPYKYMANAGVFVLSSLYEGLPNVLIEALACGCPVVSTDCPSGPLEILDNGKYGALVPMADATALADAIVSVLKRPPSAELLRERANLFTVDKSVDRYETLLFDGS